MFSFVFNPYYLHNMNKKDKSECNLMFLCPLVM